MVIGETQILSQVKQAYQLAVESNDTISLTHQVFQTAIRVARRISNETKIHSGRLSVPGMAIAVLARQIFERLSDKQVLIVGAGEMAEETLQYVKSDGGREIVVINRTQSAAETLAEKFEGHVSPWERLPDELAVADLIVSTTGATDPIVSADLFDSIAPQRHQKPLLVLDLAVPRDFDSQIGDRLNVYLYTLDDLQRECEQNKRMRKNQLSKAESILQQETDLFLAQADLNASGSTIARLKQQADEVKQAELKRLLNKIDLPPDQQQEIEASFHRLVNKILNPPLQSIRTHSQTGSHQNLLEALRRLFQLGE